MNTEQNIFNNPDPVVVTFAASWCKPCQRMKPIVEEVAKGSSGIDFVRIDIDSPIGSKLGHRFGVRTVPFFAIVKKGQITAIQPGSTTMVEFDNWIKDNT